MFTPGHLALPDVHPYLRVECIDQCEHDGCDLSDCVALANNNGYCFGCCGPARVYSERSSGETD